MFGEICDGEMILNNAGSMVSTEWLALKKRFPNIKLHEYIIMPNHFHGILEIVEASLVGDQNYQDKITGEDDNKRNGQPQEITPIGQPQEITPTGKTLGDMMDAFKSITSVKYIRGVKTKNWKRFNGRLWQRNYWEHIIRNEQSFYHISKYISNNPRKWDEDKWQLPQHTNLVIP